MPRFNHRFNSFLDRFEDRLEVDCERLKRQFVAQVDQQFGVLRTKVVELKGRFAVFGGHDHDAIPSVHLDDPEVETVSLDMGRRAADESHNAPSTSSGIKRKSTTGQSQSTKRHKSGGSTAGRNKFACKYGGCGKSFRTDAELARHERIHLGVKPFSCTWDNCSYSSEQAGPVIKHIRSIHFKLPQTVKAQHHLNMVDDRNPNDFIQVNPDLLARRLQ